VLGSEMTHNLKKNKKNNTIVTTATLVMLATIMVVAGAAPIIIGINQSAYAFVIPGLGGRTDSKAPVVVSGDNIYIAWWTNNTENGNQEVMFRASNDDGATFSDKMNLSNTTDAESTRVEIAAEGADVIVTWWETNQTSDNPVARMSEDGGATFGPLLRLAANGTIASTTEAEAAGPILTASPP
jgi:hypothetical protein